MPEDHRPPDSPADLRARLAGLTSVQLRALRERADAAGIAAPAERSEVPSLAPSGPHRASVAQERLWFLQMYAGQSPVYQSARTFRIQGPLRPELLRRAFETVVRRHECLRHTLRLEDDALCVELRPPGPLELPVREARGETPAECLRDAESRLAELARRPFDVRAGPLLRLEWVRVGTDDHCLGLCLHQLAGDGWSMAVLFRELESCYAALVRGEPTPGPAPEPGRYRSFSDWQRAQLDSPAMQAHEAYWLDRFAGAPGRSEFPTDRPRPPVESYRGRRLDFALDAERVARLEAFARAEGVTLFVLLLAAFKVLLARYSGQTDLVVGTPVANRQRVEDESTVGVFVNTLALRTDLGGEPTLREVLRRVRATSVGALAHQEYPFERLVDRLRLERDPGHHPLFQTFFAYHRFPDDALRLPGLSITQSRPDLGTSKFDLSLRIDRLASGASVAAEFATDLFDAARVERWVRHWTNLLDAFVDEPETLFTSALLESPEETRKTVAAWMGQPAPGAGPNSLPGLLAPQVRRSPHAVAVRSADRALTYRELDERSNALAHALIHGGLPPEARVGVLVPRSVDLLVGLLGILKAGGAYVPLDPASPPARLRELVADAGVEHILVSADGSAPWSDTFPGLLLLEIEDASSDRPPARSVGPEQLAYVLHTSGSTGRPKAVGLEHGGVVAALRAFLETPGLRSTDSLLASTALTFDISVLELFLPLTVGARIVLATDEERGDPTRLVGLAEREGVTIMQATPTVWALLCRQDWRPHPGLTALVGGEPVPPGVADELCRRASVVWNLYGPTETTIWSTADRLAAGSPITIGRPLTNTRVHVMERPGQPAPPGVPGELWIGGLSVARGYLNQPGLTDERFVDDPDDPGGTRRVYRTGDRVRWLPDGRLEFLGRLDRQIKLRGHRIEPGEIEARLREHPAVAEAAVVVGGGADEERRLLAYLVARAGQELAEGDIRTWLRQRLPPALIPERLIPMPALPTTPSGKLDRQQLERHRPEAAPGGSHPPPAPPLTDTQRTLAELWTKLLGRTDFGIHDSFFVLGGDSLGAIRLVDEVRRRFRRDLSITDFFAHSTIKDLSTILGSASATPGAGWPPTPFASPRS